MDLPSLTKARCDRMASLKIKSKLTTLSLFHQPAVGAVDLLKTGRFSDFTIKCGDMSFNVHKAHVYIQSAYFKSLIDGGFQETADNMVTVEGTEPLTMAMLLVLMYVGEAGQYLDQVYQIWPNLGPPVGAGAASKGGNSEKVKKSYLDQHFELELKTMISDYALADRLLIDHIAKATAAFITKYAECCLFSKLKADLPGPDIENLVSVLTHIYTATGPEDVSLREETTMICHRSQQQLLLTEPAAIRVIEKHDGRAWRLANRVVMMVKERHDALFRTDFDRFDEQGWISTLNQKLWKDLGL